MGCTSSLFWTGCTPFPSPAQERRAYKHGGEGGPGRRRSMDNGGRRSVDMGRRSLDMARLSLDGKAAPPAPGSTGSVGGSRKPGSRRQSVDLPATSHCPW